MSELLDKLNDIRVDIAAGLYEHAPEIGITVGTVAVVGAAVWACKKTLELPDILDTSNKEIEEVKSAGEEVDKKELTKAYAKATGRVIKLYRGPIIVGTLGIGSIVAGAMEYDNRITGLTATVTSLESMYNKYRKNVIERYGEDVDKEMRFGLKKETIKEKVKDEKTGKTKTVERDILTMPDGNVFEDVSEYARIWEAGASTCYDEGSREFNMLFLQQTQENANRILKKRGYIFLNEVYEMLGYPPTEAGNRVGWIRDKKHKVAPADWMGDNEVDFLGHSIDVRCPGKEEFINGFTPYMILDFNVDGDITRDGLYIKAHMYHNY